MADSFTVDVYFGNQKSVKLQPLFQYDRGMKLMLRDYAETGVPQAQFAFEGIRQTVNSAIDADAYEPCYSVMVPDIVLYQPKNVRCYIYVETEGGGTTVYEILIPIIPRARPASGTYTDSEIAAFDALLAALNSAKGKMEAMTEVVYAGSGLIFAGVNDENALVLERASLDSSDAYEIAVKNGFSGTRGDWDRFVEDLLSHATPDDAVAAAEKASQDAAKASQDAADAIVQVQEDLADFKTTSELYMLTKANEVASRSAEVGIAPTDWVEVSGSANVYTCTKACAIATEYNNLLVGFDGPLTEAQFSDIAAATIVATAQTDGHITFTAYGDKPLSTLVFNVIAFLDGNSSQSQQKLQQYSLDLNMDDGCLYLTIT